MPPLKGAISMPDVATRSKKRSSQRKSLGTGRMRLRGPVGDKAKHRYVRNSERRKLERRTLLGNDGSVVGTGWPNSPVHSVLKKHFQRGPLTLR